MTPETNCGYAAGLRLEDLSLVSPLLTDLYELSMLQVYHTRGMSDIAVFEFFVRQLPERRNFLVAAGLEQVLNFLEALRFHTADIEWLRQSGRYTPAFLEVLEGFRFTGDVDAMREGTPFFANEPVLRITAPIEQAQFVESRLMNILHVQILVASKAARCRMAAPGKILVDFGMRRAHGFEAALYAARASYLAGFDGTATVLAERMFGIPCFGTMAHSFIQAHASEAQAFESFARAQPDNAVLLIDTYDTLKGAHRVTELARRLRTEGVSIRGVRLDSGDLVGLSLQVRQILDAAGCHDIRIFASGGLDEYRLSQLESCHAPIDAYGIGTSLDVSTDAPALDCVYKIQEYAGEPRRKRSTGKATLPGRKQIYRHFNEHGVFSTDLLTVADDEKPGIPLIEPIMRAGRRLTAPPSLSELREHMQVQTRSLPRALRSIDKAARCPVEVSQRLRELTRVVDGAFN